MKILIIGGCGYIGSALFSKLSSIHSVDTVDLEWFGNYSNPKNIKKDFSELTEEFLDNYEVIIFLAANSSVTMCKNIIDTFDNNVVKFYRLVSKLKKQKFIYASSSCVYVNSSTNEKSEDALLNPLDGLTLSKTVIDQLMNLLNIEYYGLRFGSVNGWSPNMRLDLMINSMTISSIDKKEVHVFNGNAHRPILGINDLCNAVATIINSSKDNRGIYNLASYNDNIYTIAKDVAKITSSKLVDGGNNFTYDFSITSEKFKSTYGFSFSDCTHSIVKSIIQNSRNVSWGKRENKQHGL